MNWFSGTIAEAVLQSKQRNAIFVVFVEGPNENSKHMAELIDSPSVRSQLESPKFVAIRIDSQSESYTQFAQIYKLVPLPSIFFLGDNGAPLVIVTEVTKTSAELDAIIRTVLQPADNGGGTIDSTNTASTSAPTPVADTAATLSAEPALSSTAGSEQRLQRAKELLEAKRKATEAEQKRLERERELERRRTGQELRDFKERQTELELKQLKEERDRDRQLEQATRKRILQQIAQDRANSAARRTLTDGAVVASAVAPLADETTATSAPPPSRVYNGTEARIQFRKPDGSRVTNEFLATDTFRTVRDYVAAELLGGRTSQFTLAASLSRRLFGPDDADRTLAELDLAPTAVILVQSSDKALQAPPAEASRGGNGVGAGATSAMRGAVAAVARIDWLRLAQSTFWLLMLPVVAVFGYCRFLLSGWGGGRAGRDNGVASERGGGSTHDATGAQKRENEERLSDNDAAKRRNLRFLQLDGQQPQSSASNPSSGAYKRPTTAGPSTSNIHRLRETQDSDDDTNTWNGNSTQQQ